MGSREFALLTEKRHYDGVSDKAKALYRLRR